MIERLRPHATAREVCEYKFEQAYRTAFHKGLQTVGSITGLNGMVEVIALETPRYLNRTNQNRFLLFGPSLDNQPSVVVPNSDDEEEMICAYILLAVAKSASDSRSFAELSQDDLHQAVCYTIGLEHQTWSKLGEAVTRHGEAQELARELQFASIVPELPAHLVIGQ